MPTVPDEIVFQVMPSVERSMRYPVTALPPFDAGAFQESATWPLDAVAPRFCGTVGTLAGVAITTELAAPDPTAFNALIRNE